MSQSSLLKIFFWGIITQAIVCVDTFITGCWLACSGAMKCSLVVFFFSLHNSELKSLHTKDTKNWGF